MDDKHRLSGATGETSMRRITIRRPDDWHVHLRDGLMLSAVLPFTAAQFARGLVMPNLRPPITTVAAAAAYRQRIVAALPEETNFQPLMTCYLTDSTCPDELEHGYLDGVWVAAKLYPAGATTNSESGVRNIGMFERVLDRLEKLGMPLLVHGETPDPAVDIFEREAVFLEQTLVPLLNRHSDLKVVVEHITTSEAIDVVRAYTPRVAATITPHHLVINRTSIFQGGLRPHLYCLPVAKHESHRLALRAAAVSGECSFFAGTDTAPHSRDMKETECCSAGIFAAPTALQTYAQVFDEENALDNLEKFVSLNGAGFYGLPVNEDRIVLEKRPSRIMTAIGVDDSDVVVFQGGISLPWSIGIS